LYIIGSFDRFFSGYIRKEYTRDLEDRIRSLERALTGKPL